MPNKFETRDQVLKHTYLEAVRHVMIVDDRYPSFEQIGQNLVGGDFLHEEALRIWGDFRTMGWPCDITNRCHLDDGELKILDRADLVVLDYHLERGDDTNPRHALRILDRLATSSHFNVVALHTAEPDLYSVQKTIGSFLRGVTDVRGILSDHEYEQWEDIFDQAPQPVQAGILNFIQGLPGGWKDARDVQQYYRDAGIAPGSVVACVQAQIEQSLGDIFRSYGGDPARPIRNVSMSSLGVEPRWVHCGNVFVVIVPKNQQEIVPSIEAAIENWNPSPLHVALSAARNVIVQGGSDFERRVLNDPVLHTGLIMQVLDCGSEEQSERVSIVIEALFERLRYEAEEELQQLVPTMFAGERAANFNPFDEAKALSRALAKAVPQERDAIHAFNEFLCTEPYQRKAVTTGTVFCGEDNVGKQGEVFYVCVTPACDMVPRMARDPLSWAKDIHPYRAMNVIRAQCVEGYQGTSPTNGRHLYLTYNGKRIALELADKTTHLVRSELLVAENMAITEDRTFTAFQLSKKPPEVPGAAELAEQAPAPLMGEAERPIAQEGAPATAEQPQLLPVKFRIVAQMRKGYADRILHEAGFSASRVGVDYVNFPAG